MSPGIRFLFRLSCALVILAPAALAHPMQGVGDFYAGMLHPLTTLEALLPLIAMSLLAGQQPRDTAVRLLVAFPATLAAGTLLILYRPAFPWVNTGEFLLTAALGILVALSLRLPGWIPLSLAIGLALTIGWTNVAEISPNMSSFRFVAGLVTVGLLLVAYGIGLVRSLKWPQAQIAVRVVGSWIAAVGILVLGLK